MAPSTQIREGLPETLPEDFVQWDEASPSAQAAQSPDAEPGPASVSKPAAEAVEAQRAGLSSVNLLRGAALSPSVPERRGDTAISYRERSSSAASRRSREIAVPLHAAGPAIDELRSSAPHPNAAGAADPATMAGLHQTVLLGLRANALEITRVTRRKWPIIAAVSAALAVTLVAATIPMLNRGRDASAKPTAVPAPQMTTLQQPEHAPPSPADSRLTAPASTATPSPGAARIGSESAVRPLQKNAGVSHEQAQMMDHQLHTPAQLHMKATLPEPASLQQGFDSSVIHGLENSNPSGVAFGEPKGLRVQIASPQAVSSKKLMEQVASHQAITVSPGVALSLLVQNRRPIYPLIAKSARLSGIVVLAATISTIGKVDNLRVVSGPEMLRESALDAVRTWRFRPYMLNNQPKAFETTITLNFKAN
jgi:periplasmic protein TonB